jgi:hypothetical protein
MHIDQRKLNCAVAVVVHAYTNRKRTSCAPS